jgi:hypothetical protein
LLDELSGSRQLRQLLLLSGQPAAGSQLPQFKIPAWLQVTAVLTGANSCWQLFCMTTMLLLAVASTKHDLLITREAQQFV